MPNHDLDELRIIILSSMIFISIILSIIYLIYYIIFEVLQ